jgi:hypothetical protein
MEVLKAHDWPGNIRELQNFIERAMVFSPDSVLYLPLKDLKQMTKQPSDAAARLCRRRGSLPEWVPGLVRGELNERNQGQPGFRRRRWSAHYPRQCLARILMLSAPTNGRPQRNDSAAPINRAVRLPNHRSGIGSCCCRLKNRPQEACSTVLLTLNLRNRHARAGDRRCGNLQMP